MPNDSPDLVISGLSDRNNINLTIHGTEMSFGREYCHPMDNPYEQIYMFGACLIYQGGKRIIMVEITVIDPDHVVHSDGDGNSL